MGVMAEGTHYTQKETLFQASLLMLCIFLYLHRFLETGYVF